MGLRDKAFLVYLNSTNYTDKCHRMGLEEITLTFSDYANDSLYIGYKKPQKTMFFEVSEAATNTPDLTTSYWDGTDWVEIDKVDETNGLQQSGFLFIDSGLENSVKKTINGKEAFWVRVQLSANSVVKLKGLNVLFCSEEDLMTALPDVKRYYPRAISSHILTLVRVRDDILREINNSNHHIYTYDENDPLLALRDGTTVRAEDFNQFDLDNVSELKDVAIYLAGYWIMSQRKDGSNDDKFIEEANRFYGLYKSKLQLWQGRRLTLDIDGDGSISNSEVAASIKTGSFTR